MNRRQFLAAASVVALSSSLSSDRSLFATTAPSSAPATKESSIPDNVVWRDVRDWGVEGKAFSDTQDYFDRLPAGAEKVVRKEVWTLSKNSTGMSVRFETDATEIYARYTLTSAVLSLNHMPASGVSGLDLYGQKNGKWHYAGGRRPSERTSAGALARSLSPGKRLYQVNLPLYNGVKSLEIGVAKDAAFTPVPPRTEKPVLFYGTSITQGGCASRPGMAFVAILGRRLNRPMLNFGFSGNGKMEPKVAQFLAELDPAIFVLDCLANMGAVPIVPKTIEVVELLRKRHADTPILILEERPWTDAALLQNRQADHEKRNASLREAFDKLQAAGVKNLHFRKCDDVIGTDDEGTVDGSHPTDLGMMRYANALEPDLRKLLAGS